MAKPVGKKKAHCKSSVGVFTKLLILALLLALGWQLYLLREQVQEAQTQKSQLTDQVQQQQQTNNALKADIADGGSQDKMEEIARDQLGMVAPGDKVFYDVSN